MNTMTRIATAAALAAVGMGASASIASAYTLDPPSTSFTGTNSGLGNHIFTAGGAPVSCSSASFAGATPASGPTASFKATYTGCTLTLGGIPLSATVTTNSNWDLTVTGGTGPWTGDVSITSGSPHAVVIRVPAVGCELYVDAANNGTLSQVTGTNTTPTGVRLVANVVNISYTQNGSCLGVPASGSNATYTGSVQINGVTITN